MAQSAEDLIPTRATLLHRLKDWQDQSSWQDFFDTYWKLIHGVALKAGLDKSEAEEVVQETMIAVARHMPAFQYDRSLGSFKLWLLNLTRWRIADQIRKRHPRAAPHSAKTQDCDTRIMAEIPDPVSQRVDSLWDEEWASNLLDAALTKVKRRLEPEKFQIFDFYVNKDWPPEKVARAFGVSVGQVYLAKHRVTEMIADEVKKLEQAIELTGNTVCLTSQD